MNDRVYIFDKITFKRELLGEIQADFNMSLVIDGTKDSISLLVWSYKDFEIEPNTILWHENTNTWWCIVKDKIERYENENGALYVHNIDLNGAIELFNVRDMTDCGFNDKTYTVGEFITRIVNMSSFEYDFVIDTELNLSNRVDFLKTYENYSPLRALTEFLDAYNSCAKLEFVTGEIDNETYIDHAILKILLKTGNSNFANHNITDFKDTRETKSLDKNSFGTCVISNADNVVSTQAKTYPSVGAVGFSANEYDIKVENALIRLPNNVYKLNWLKMVSEDVYLRVVIGNMHYNIKICYGSDEVSIANINKALEDTFTSWVETNVMTQEQFDWLSTRENQLMLIRKAQPYFSVTFYDGIRYLPNDTFEKPNSVPYILEFNSDNVGGQTLKIITCQKDIKQNMLRPLQGIAWERGNNLITGFEFLLHNYSILMKYVDAIGGTTGGSNEIYRQGDDILHDMVVFAGQTGNPDNTTIEFNRKSRFVINYIPMSNLKIKVDNQRDKKDIKIYNQNGKFSDSYALSKLLNSYSKEISSDSITRYGQYYDYDSVPKVGSFVFKGNETYVINNVSLTFVQNENGYFIDCEFSMSKWVSTKSIMVNPNTNVRDYGIPQQYNVKRKQLYRDYYELDYDFYNDANQETPFLTLKQILNLGNEYRKTNDYSVYIEIEYDSEIDGSYNWYYQLECSTILMQKQVMLAVDFNDNNIIGYCQNSRGFIFDVSNLFNQRSLINTPISYVDDNGRFKGVKMLFVNEKDKSQNNGWYYDYTNYLAPYDALAIQVFIPQELFNYAYNNNKYDFMISEPDYNKDALEIPFFEYCCQIDDSDNVLVGDNILQQYENSVYFYDFISGNHLTQNDSWDINTVVHGSEEIEPDVWVEYWEIDNAIKIEYNGSYEIRIKRYESARYYPGENRWVYGNQLTIPTGVDIAIYRHSVIGSQETDLLFICKNVSSEHIIDSGKTLVLKVNHYKLK